MVCETCCRITWELSFEFGPEVYRHRFHKLGMCIENYEVDVVVADGSQDLLRSTGRIIVSMEQCLSWIAKPV